MKFGLKKDTINAINFIFNQYPEIDIAYIYGSRAKGNYRPNSDIDLTLKGENIDLNTQLRIETDLDDLLLPYKIDLSIYHKIENKDLLDHIDRVGLVFYKKKEEFQVENDG